MISVNFNGVINATVPVEGTSTNGIKLSGNAVFNSSLKVTNFDGQFIDEAKQESIGSFNMYDGRMDYSFRDYAKAGECISVFNELLAAIEAKGKEGIMLTAPAQEPAAENQ